MEKYSPDRMLIFSELHPFCPANNPSQDIKNQRQVKEK
jgi:hypothetical protein